MELLYRLTKPELLGQLLESTPKNWGRFTAKLLPSIDLLKTRRVIAARLHMNEDNSPVVHADLFYAYITENYDHDLTGLFCEDKLLSGANFQNAGGVQAAKLIAGLINKGYHGHVEYHRGRTEMLSFNYGVFVDAHEPNVQVSWNEKESRNNLEWAIQQLERFTSH